MGKKRVSTSRFLEISELGRVLIPTHRVAADAINELLNEVIALEEEAEALKSQAEDATRHWFQAKDDRVKAYAALVQEQDKTRDLTAQLEKVREAGGRLFGALASHSSRVVMDLANDLIRALSETPTTKENKYGQ